MKNAIKKILILSTLCVTCFTFASCSLINLGSGGGSIFEEKIDYSEYRKDYDNTNPFGGSGIYQSTKTTNEFGVDKNVYGGGMDTAENWKGGNNGAFYIKNVFDIVTPIYTEKYLEDSLKEAKEAIASENMSVNYKTLFNNKTYTNSNIAHELSIENTVGLNSYIEFEQKMFEAFDDAIARKENFLIYCPEYTGKSETSSGYGQPVVYGYVEGLGYIVIAVSKYGSITISVENKYFTRIDIDNNVSTWYSNEDAIKIPIWNAGDGYKGMFWDYSPNMIRATTYGLFSENSDDFIFDNTRFAFTEGNYLGIGGKNNALHLYGARTESKYTNEYINNNFYFSSTEYLGGYLTDFNNFFYGDNTYALFGELADFNLKKIVNAMFSVKMQPCNDFEEDCNWFEIIIDKNSKEEYKEKYYDDPSTSIEEGTLLRLRRIVDYFDFDLIQELDYAYPKSNVFNNIPYKYNGKYYYFDGGDVTFAKYVEDDGTITCPGVDWYNWYEALEIKPYIKSYENIDGNVTVRNWSLCLGGTQEELSIFFGYPYNEQYSIEYLNNLEKQDSHRYNELIWTYFANGNAEVSNKYVGLTIEGFERKDYLEYEKSMSKYGFSDEDAVKGWFIQITDENNVFRLRFEN